MSVVFVPQSCGSAGVQIYAGLESMDVKIVPIIGIYVSFCPLWCPLVCNGTIILKNGTNFSACFCCLINFVQDF